MASRKTNIISRFPQYRGCRFDLQDLPTCRQFKYAVALGIVQTEMSFASVSSAIDEAKKGHINWVEITEEEANELYDAILDKAPVDGQDRETFQMMHVKLPRGCNAADAEAIEDYLSDDAQFRFACPFCKQRILYDDWFAGIMLSEACPKCGASWKSLVIQTSITRGKPPLISAEVTTNVKNADTGSCPRRKDAPVNLEETSYATPTIERLPNGYSVTVHISPKRNSRVRADSTPGCLIIILLPFLMWILSQLS